MITKIQILSNKAKGNNKATINTTRLIYLKVDLKNVKQRII